MSSHFDDEDRKQDDDFGDLDFGGGAQSSSNSARSDGKFTEEDEPTSQRHHSRASVDSSTRMWDEDSQFSAAPVEIVESSDGFAFDHGENESRGSDEDDGYDMPKASHASPASSAKGKPNYAVLGVAALAGLGLLAGGGYMGATMLGLTGGADASVPILIEAPAHQEHASSGVFADLETNPAQEAAPSIFGDTGALDSAAVGEAAAAAAATVAVAGTSGVLTAPTPQAAAGAVMAQVDDLLAQQPVAAAPATPAATTPATRQAGAATPVAPATPAATTPATRQAGAATPVAPATPAVTTRRSETPRAANNRQDRQVARKPRSTREPPRQAARQVPREAIRDTSVHVMAIYPQSGSFVQAWVRDREGRVVSVREGDLFMGVQIRAIRAERMEVETADGRLWLPNQSVPAYRPI